MGHFSSMFNGLARSLSIKRTKKGCRNCDVREVVEAVAKDAKKNELILRTSGILKVEGSKNMASVCSKRGEKGVNQDCCIVWEVKYRFVVKYTTSLVIIYQSGRISQKLYVFVISTF